MREVVLDTETTGLSPNNGDRLVEIGCIELINHIATNESFHCYLNPQRDMPAEAEAIHGLSSSFLLDKPLFSDVVDDFLNFIGDSPMVIHNASFDMGFINSELKIAGREPLPLSQSVDTVSLARERYPGSPASLDALCRRFQIDNSHRTLHGALLDAELLAEVYLELKGGRQPDLALQASQGAARLSEVQPERVFRQARDHRPSEAEEAAHALLLKRIAQPLWNS